MYVYMYVYVVHSKDGLLYYSYQFQSFYPFSEKHCDHKHFVSLFHIFQLRI